jgi:hypothetical protein
MSKRSTLFVLLTLAAAQAAVAHDKWEYVVYNASDDDSTTLNFLQHGARQVGHDLHDIGSGPLEQDWYAFKATAGHSYEARVNSGNMYWSTTCTPTACPRFDRMNSVGGVLTLGQISPDDAPIVINRAGSGPQNAGRGMTVRWIAAVTEIGFLRAVTDVYSVLGPDMPYDISFRDTTYFAPRWNNSGTQVSVFILQNTTAQTVSGTVAFHNAAGTLLASSVVSVPPDGVQVISTASLSALVGQSGSATIAQSGGYGALAGKVVSLEPSTGFTFDTALAPLPY